MERVTQRIEEMETRIMQQVQTGAPQGMEQMGTGIEARFKLIEEHVEKFQGELRESVQRIEQVTGGTLQNSIQRANEVTEVLDKRLKEYEHEINTGRERINAQVIELNQHKAMLVSTKEEMHAWSL